ncbi:formyltransferase family protein [Aeromonas enteropelogenes]|uniref:formyltransferase family protein n=1 Tax=Aeromonas enteropelogenes TaxID=29489 RepID=UPI003B9E3884
MKVILCGYHWAGCYALEQLLTLTSDVFVYTHESLYHIPCLQELCQLKGIQYTTKIIDIDNLPFVPDLIVSIYYRNIIKNSILDVCKYKAFNLHPSLLPDYKGCSSLTWAIINNEKEVGFSYHYIDEKIDAGAIVLQKTVPVYVWDTQGTLYYRVMYEALNYLLDVVHLVISGAEGVKQSAGGRYYRRGCPYNGIIEADWSQEKVKCFIRAMTFPPYPPASYKGRPVLSFSDYLKLKDEESQ